MEYALVGMGVLVLLVVVAAGTEAYLKSNSRRPLAASRPDAAEIRRQATRRDPAQAPIPGQKSFIDTRLEQEEAEAEDHTRRQQEALKARQRQDKTDQTPVGNPQRG